MGAGTTKRTLSATVESGFAILAHRGTALLAPENTMPAFAIALGMGLDIELDVYETKDGHLVVIHDGSVGRTTNGTGSVTEMLLSEVKALDAGAHFGAAFGGATIPTLEEVLQLARQVRPNATIALNMKTLAPSIEEKIADLVQQYDMLDRVFAFDMPLSSARRFKAAASAFPAAASIRDTDGGLLSANSTTPGEDAQLLDKVLSLPYIDCIWACESKRRWITAALVAKIQSQGKRVYATEMCTYQPSEWERLIQAGVNGICVNDGVRLRELLHAKYDAYRTKGKWA